MLALSLIVDGLDSEQPAHCVLLRPLFFSRVFGSRVSYCVWSRIMLRVTHVPGITLRFLASKHEIIPRIVFCSEVVMFSRETRGALGEGSCSRIG